MTSILKTLLLLGLLFTPLTAWAIGQPSTSFFVKGLNHPLMVPAHLIALFALSLLLGQQGWRAARVVIPVFIIALSSALVMTRYQTATWDAELTLLPIAALTGILVVLKWKLPILLPLCIAILVAVVIGMDSSVPRIPGLQSAKIYAHLAGSGVIVSGLLIIVSAIAFFLRNLLAGVILRVLGAWATAGAILVVTLLMVTPVTP